MTARKRAKVDAEADAIRALDADPRAPDAVAKLRTALGHAHWMVVTSAAEIVGRHALGGFEQELARVWPRFSENGAKLDPFSTY